MMGMVTECMLRCGGQAARPEEIWMAQGMLACWREPLLSIGSRAAVSYVNKGRSLISLILSCFHHRFAQHTSVENMSAALVNTSWPSTAISADAQNLLGNFFALADDPAASAGPELASKVFTRDGVMKAATGAFEGSEGTCLRSRCSLCCGIT